ncbi:dephospho-CoA kinase [Owenweeksia hongkongensis DSM 17368]|uniref:Dephospho-CoA kinase n=1 Tax=Owenweeksia hongkongensis (strain DSM 17368 / CIP 108786 / JCM 12287 / NRRL B-23963 / UST20020801) TaxID=926562 RepID=G8R2R8_OWEHD|nr:dephospho-CoA kinase [Owenweeksia hongkongensis]AEV31873.1 dephospho-CoA kinase [Owenweeksia hongkongensis DSM 17368]
MIIGLTGGIGSGKSTVAKIFEFLGVPVYEADAFSKTIIDTDKELQAEVVSLLGTEIIEEGKIVRPKMAELIFGDKNLLQKANDLIHPAVARHFQNWYENQSYPYVIKEAAILFESGSYKSCDKILVVAAPKEMRINRVMARSSMTREEVEARMNNQWPQEQKLEKADYIVTNDLTESVIKQVINIHENIIRTANSGSR